MTAEQREQLRHWPYTIHRIDEKLDIGLIEGKARQILFQSINTRSLCAFAGSGMSASYGRMSWGDWKDTQLEIVETNAETFIGLCGHALDWIKVLRDGISEPNKTMDWQKSLYEKFNPEQAPKLSETDRAIRQQHYHNVDRWLDARRRSIQYAKVEMERLFVTFKSAKSKDGTFPGGEALPVQFEIAQQLHDQLLRHIDLFAPREPGSSDPEFTCYWTGSRESQDSATPVKALKSLGEALNNALKRKTDEEETCNNTTIQTKPVIPEPHDGDEITPEPLKKYFEAWDAFRIADGTGAARQSFEMLTKFLLVDECGHAAALLKKGLKREGNTKALQKLERTYKLYDPSKLKRDLDGIRREPGRYVALSPFTFDKLKKVFEVIKTKGCAPDWVPFLERLETRINKYLEQAESGGDKRVYLTPTSRFMLSAMLRLLPNPFENLSTFLVDEEQDPTALQKEAGTSLVEIPPRNSFTSRRSIIADRFDPLAKTVRKLGIRRYITTNYDFEIERFFDDGGFSRFGPRSVDLNVARSAFEHDPALGADDFRSDHLGAVLSDQTFTRDHASDLVAFTVGQQRSNAAVFHLHGRATIDDELVISERDYLDLYLTEDGQREEVDEAIRTAFSGAPVLFLGLGMNEADLLRPLRQFISNKDRTVGYSAVTLLPAEKGYDARVKTSSSLYLRYGVHTIFYGSGTIDRIDENGTQVTYPDSGKPQRIGVDWLHRILSLTSAVTDFVSWLQKGEGLSLDRSATLAKWKVAFIEHLDEKLGAVGEDLADVEFITAKTRVLNVLLGMRTVAQSDPGESINAAKIVEAFEASDESENGIVLRVPTFTPTRRRSTDPEIQHSAGKQQIKGSLYVGWYVRLLEDVIRLCLTPSPKLSTDVETERQNCDLAARQIMLDGLWGAFLGTSMNAALDSLENEWRAWWKDWQRQPAHRKARFEHFKYKDTAADDSFIAPPRFVRHRVDSVITDTSEIEEKTCPAPLPLDAGQGSLTARGKVDPAWQTRVRSFDTFIAAIANQMNLPEDPASPQGRRFYTVAALRGQGKGTFMTAMSSRLGLSLYLRAAWPASGIADLNGQPLRTPDQDFNVAFAAAIFVNFSFSSEIASNFDMILREVRAADARLRAYLAVLESSSQVIGQATERELRTFFKAVCEDSDRRCKVPEVLANLWAAYRNERAKVSIGLPDAADSISRIKALELALDSFDKTCVEMGDLNVSLPKPRLFLCINAADLLFWPDGRPKNGEIEKFLDLILGNKAAGYPLDLIVIGSESRLGRPWRKLSGKLKAKTLVLKQIDRAGLPHAAVEHIDRRKAAAKLQMAGKNSTHHGFVHFARPVSPMEMMISNFPVLARALFLYDEEALAHFAKDPTADNTESLSKKLDDARNRWRESELITWTQKGVPKPEDLIKAQGVALGEFHDALNKAVVSQLEWRNITGQHIDVDGILRERYRADGNVDARDWHKIRRYLGGNRFCLTILLAAAQHIVESAANLKIGTLAAETFIRGTVDQVRNVGKQRKEDIVLETVLESYRRHHVIGRFDADIDLHMLLIRHLTVIGTPVSAAVLVRLPEIRDYFANLREDPQMSRRRTVAAALSVLCSRGLIFRLTPNPSMLQMKDETTGQMAHRDWPLDREFRYCLHRVVQRHAASLLGQGRVDPVQDNSFSPTLYASMSSGGSRLSREAYIFLRRQMVAQSQYPDIPVDQAETEPLPFKWGEHEVQVQALRAALSLARASFSVASISRFADYRRLIADADRGYLEVYKVRLRWLIRHAWQLGEKQTDFNALYRDEVVWLYNELGVTSLAQGNLTDALALLRQAAEFNATIEGASMGGPVGNLIGVNHAVVQLERGRLASARTRLERIKRDTKASAGSVHHIARGYLCVIDHLQGRSQNLDGRFKKVTDYFQKKGDKRAAAIFLHHRARFLSLMDVPKARRLLTVARQLAETGGHEDIRHHIQIAEILVALAAAAPEERIPNAELYDKLREIEVFGRRMGIWSLQCDALQLHARVLIEQGETANAGQLLTRGLAIANRCSLTLRSNRGMTLYAQLLQRRGNLAGAETIAINSLELAKTLGFSLETVRAQHVLASVKQRSETPDGKR